MKTGQDHISETDIEKQHDDTRRRGKRLISSPLIMESASAASDASPPPSPPPPPPSKIKSSRDRIIIDEDELQYKIAKPVVAPPRRSRHTTQYPESLARPTERLYQVETTRSTPEPVAALKQAFEQVDTTCTSGPDAERSFQYHVIKDLRSFGEPPGPVSTSQVMFASHVSSCDPTLAQEVKSIHELFSKLDQYVVEKYIKRQETIIKNAMESIPVVRSDVLKDSLETRYKPIISNENVPLNLQLPPIRRQYLHQYKNAQRPPLSSLQKVDRYNELCMESLDKLMEMTQEEEEEIL